MTERYDGPTEEIDQREFVLAYLQRERELWLPHHLRSERDGRMNAELNANADAFMPKIDRLLDELNALGRAAIGGA